jgi:hypothetical protein
MVYNFLLEFVDIFSFLNVFKYITFRTGLAVFTSLILVLIIGGPFIRMVSKKKIVNPIREDGPTDHIIKKNRHTYDGWIGYINGYNCFGNYVVRFDQYLYFIFIVHLNFSRVVGCPR